MRLHSLGTTGDWTMCPPPPGIEDFGDLTARLGKLTRPPERSPFLIPEGWTPSPVGGPEPSVFPDWLIPWIETPLWDRAGPHFLSKLFESPPRDPFILSPSGRLLPAPPRPPRIIIIP